MKSNNQFFDLMFGGVSPYRIDAADGALTSKSYDALYVTTAATLTTLTATGAVNMLSASNITSDTDEIEAGMILKPAQGLKIIAVTVKTATDGVVWGLTMPSPSV